MAKAKNKFFVQKKIQKPDVPAAEATAAAKNLVKRGKIVKLVIVNFEKNFSALFSTLFFF